MKRYQSLLFALLFVIVLPFHSQAQIIITVAGEGNEGYSGDTSAAVLAKLHWPKSVALDTFGNFYIADAQNNCVRKVNAKGIITTIAGNGFEAGTGDGTYSGDDSAATTAQLFDPEGVVMDRKGRLYIADAGNNRVRKVDTAGIITTVAGTGLASYGGDGAAATLAQLNMPVRVAVDTFGNLYIVDKMNNRIRKVDTFGIITTIAGNGLPNYSGDGGQATAATLNFPADVAVDSVRNVFIADQLNECVRKVDTFGVITTFAGINEAGFRGDGGPATAAMLYDPEGLAIDDSGNVYISDNGNARVRVVNDTGVITTIAGNGTGSYNGDGRPATSAELWFPQGLAINAKGHLYVADQGNNRIRLLGTIPTEFIKALNNSPADISAYPNPSRGTFMLNVSSNVEEQAQVIITNVAGEKINEITTTTNHTVPIAISTSPGVYFVSATTAHGAWNKKIVVY